MMIVRIVFWSAVLITLIVFARRRGWLAWLASLRSGGAGGVTLSPDAIFLTLGWGFLLAFPLFLGDKGEVGSVRDWWWNIVKDKVGLALIAGFTIFGFMMYKNPAKPFRYKLAKIGAWILVPFAIWHISGKPGLASVKSWWNGNENSQLTQDFSYPPALSENKEARVMYDKWMASGLSKAEAFEMFEVCLAESNGKQFEPDGTTPLIGRYPDGKPNGAIGICQPKPSAWGEGGKKFNAKTIEGNVDMAIWIRKKPEWEDKWAKLTEVRNRRNQGSPTKPFSDIRLAVSQMFTPAPPPVAVVPSGVATYRSERVVTVPVGEWTDWIDFARGRCRGTPDREVQAEDDLGRPYTLFPEKLPHTSATMFRYTVAEEPAGKLVIRCEN